MKYCEARALSDALLSSRITERAVSWIGGGPHSPGLVAIRQQMGSVADFYDVPLVWVTHSSVADVLILNLILICSVNILLLSIWVHPSVPFLMLLFVQVFDDGFHLAIDKLKRIDGYVKELSPLSYDVAEELRNQ